MLGVAIVQAGLTALTRLRRFGRPLPPGILNAPAGLPIIDTAVGGGFVVLAEDAPGFGKAAMNFLIEPDGAAGSVVTAETRVHATDARSARRFAIYWRIIQPGSGFIRRMWLRAIERRVEKGPT